MKRSFHHHTIRTAVVEFLAGILVRSFYVEGGGGERERKRETTASASSIPTDNDVGETEQELKTHFFIWV
jgi:hypothetical protein